MRPHLASVNLAGLGLLLLLSAQTQLCGQAQVTTVPAVYKGAYSNQSLTAPFGRSKFFGQTWYSGMGLPAVIAVTQVGWRTSPGRSFAALTTRMSLVLDNSKTTFTGLSKTFTANLSNQPTTFLKMKTIKIPAVTNSPGPDSPNVWIPGDTPFVYLGPNLIVQMDVQQSATATSTGYNVEGYSMNATQPTRLLNRGRSCGASKLLNTFSSASNSFAFYLSGAPAAAPVLLHLSLAGLPSAVDLSVIGMNGCELYLNPMAIISLAADAGGNAILRGSLPSLLPSFTVHGQASHPQAGSNPANYVSTNSTAALIGHTGISTYVYNWSRFSPTAQYGPYNTNRGQIMLMR